MNGSTRHNLVRGEVKVIGVPTVYAVGPLQLGWKPGGGGQILSTSTHQSQARTVAVLGGVMGKRAGGQNIE